MTADPHPLDLLRAEARTATVPEVRRELDALSARQAEVLNSPHWGAGAEDTLRASIGMGRKMTMEMRLGLGDDWAALPLRKTAPLAEMTLPDLLAEARAGREHLLQVLDSLLRTAQHREVRAWCYGEEVPPELYILGLRRRLAALDSRVAGARNADMTG
ncbi:hypothetical protein GCM10010840_15430 [Deinococcus aerolatus]|uniref:Uncharacterized protein n=1 Tax=Deinococcus aerolatus TaxID=522487 RepID=A0ABQ2G6Z5_9DEIO|nr:hypothetical protein [Deinococcus aerolatus]GGL78504.1 hypothetical protein GCM10010840_15430 [Deinococcus aerolatus]